MCGLTGYYTKNNIHENKIISEMSNSLISRGPDDIGYWVDNSMGISLGHRRLSIQDLSENGSQPMFSHTKRNVIVFNGEIYNHLSLRELLEKEYLKYNEEHSREHPHQLLRDNQRFSHHTF